MPELRELSMYDFYRTLAEWRNELTVFSREFSGNLIRNHTSGPRAGVSTIVRLLLDNFDRVLNAAENADLSSENKKLYVIHEERREKLREVATRFTASFALQEDFDLNASQCKWRNADGALEWVVTQLAWTSFTAKNQRNLHRVVNLAARSLRKMRGKELIAKADENRKRCEEIFEELQILALFSEPAEAKK